MKYIIYYLHGFFIQLLHAQLELCIIHLHDVHDNLTFDDTYTDEVGLENETAYFIEHMPKLVRFVKWIRKENRKRDVRTIVLNTGAFTGNRWSSDVTKNSINLMNQLSIDYSSIGTHGFDFDNLNETNGFIQKLNFPVLCSNFEGNKPLQNVENSKVVTFNDSYRVGIIGYYTPHASETGVVSFTKETYALKQEAKKLRNFGVNTIIALGHSGHDHETIFAKNVKNVDLFVGSHLKKLYKNGQTSQVYPIRILEGEDRVFKYFEIYRFSKDMHITKFNIKIDASTGAIYDSKLSSFLDDPDKLARKLLMMERNTETNDETNGETNVEMNDNDKFDDGYPPYFNYNESIIRSKGSVHLVEFSIGSCLYFLFIVMLIK